MQGGPACCEHGTLTYFLGIDVAISFGYTYTIVRTQLIGDDASERYNRI